MYEIHESLIPYYREIDPQKRFEILNSLQSSESLEFQHRLYKDRYTDPKHPERKKVDWWLWRCVCLTLLYGRGKLFRKFMRKELQDILNELHMNNSESYTHDQQSFLYNEYRNTARRYLSTCRSDGYASGLLGLRKATNEEKIFKACEDIWIMSKGIARAGDVQEEMKLWCDALHVELLDFDPMCREYYENIDSGTKFR